MLSAGLFAFALALIEESFVETRVLAVEQRSKDSAQNPGPNVVVSFSLGVTVVRVATLRGAFGHVDVALELNVSEQDHHFRVEDAGLVGERVLESNVKALNGDFLSSSLFGLVGEAVVVRFALSIG